MTSSLHTVMVPGLLCSSRLYAPLLPTAWSHGPVTIADNRRESTMTALAERVLAAAPERFLLVGLSMGGYVALEVMRLAADRVSALALISTSARPDSPEQVASRLEQRRAVEAGRYDELADLAFPVIVDPGHLGRDDLRATWRAMVREVGAEGFLRQLEATMGRPDSRPDLVGIRCPVAVLHGDGDQLIAPDNGVELADGILGAELTLVEGGGHMLPHEQPVATSAALEDLYGRVRP